MLKKLVLKISNDTNLAIVLSLIFTTLLLALLYLLSNKLTNDFDGITYIQPKLLIFLVPAIILFTFAVFFAEESPRLSFTPLIILFILALVY